MNYLLLIQTLIAAVKSVEKLMPESAGKDKFDAAIVLVEAIIGDVQPLVPVLMDAATLLVKGFRATGAFEKK